MGSHRQQPPLAVRPRSSRRLAAFVLCTHLAAAAAVLALPGGLWTLLLIPVAMALFFAPYLVALNAVPVGRALKLSFQGCWRNVLPFVVFSLVVLGFGLASLLTLGLAWLILMPWLTLAVYIAFREIYYAR